MKQKVTFILIGLALFSIVTGCSENSSEEPIDLTAVEAILTTEPEVVTAGTPFKLKTTFTDMNVSDQAKVVFDFRIDEEPTLLDAVNEGDGEFSGTFTFAEKGSYTVYIHFYDADIHLAKKKTIEVQ